jgi:hypothetical protein
MLAFVTGETASMVEMDYRQRRAGYVSLWLFALAFGLIEASAVLYLREIYVRDASLSGTGYFPNLQATLVSLPGRLVALEMAREVGTLVVLSAVAWLAGRRRADRIGAFLVAFGVWDLVYYAVLRLVSGWPGSISTWDILFLIPYPWVAPVWAPVAVATFFVLAGSHLFWDSERERRYHRADVGMLASAVFITLAAFLLGTKAAIAHQVPEHFPALLFWSGVALGVGWFVRAERRVVRTGDRRRPLMGGGGHSGAPATFEEAADEEADIGRIIAAYREDRRRDRVGQRSQPGRASDRRGQWESRGGRERRKAR